MRNENTMLLSAFKVILSSGKQLVIKMKQHDSLQPDYSTKQLLLWMWKILTDKGSFNKARMKNEKWGVCVIRGLFWGFPYKDLKLNLKRSTENRQPIG